MAEVAVFFVTGRVQSIVSEMAMDEKASLGGIDLKLSTLSHELSSIPRLLDRARRYGTNGAELKKWVGQTLDLAYELEDVADSIAFIIWRKKDRYAMPLIGISLRRCASKPFRLKLSYTVAGKVAILEKKLDDLRKTLTHHCNSIVEEEEDDRKEDVGGREAALCIVGDDNYPPVGIENIAGDLRSKLSGEPAGLLVATVVGEGGVGKTTLAREIYRSVDHDRFPLRAWLTFSKDDASTVDEVVTEIAEQASPAERYKLQSMKDEDLRRAHVKVSLMEKPYLIVMDNVCEVDVWERVRSHLPDSRNGSRVLITTREERVARRAVPCFPPCVLQGLDSERSWELFARNAFSVGEVVGDVCAGELEELARGLVRSCRGLPLALVTLGRFLHGKQRSWVSWKRAVEGVNWEEKNGEKVCMEILRLGYDDLPVELKGCFLYLGAFRRDREVEVERLVRLLVAEGFFFFFALGEGEVATKEAAAGLCLEELNRRGMIEFKEKRERRMRQFGSLVMFKDSTKTFCGMHDMVRDLCNAKAMESNFMTVVPATTAVASGTRRCSLVGEAAVGGSASSLRTLLAFNVRTCLVDFRNFKFLRVVDLEQSKVAEIPEGIGYMRHLKYLGLGGTHCRGIPASLCEVSTLETLDLRGTFVKDLPVGFWRITNLRHVLCECEPYMVSSDVPTALQTLELVRTGPWVEPTLGMLANLRFLDLWGDLRCYPGLRLPTNLEVLNLYESRFGEDVWAQVEELKLLRTLYLSLDAYPFQEMVCRAGSFPRLEELSILKLSALETWTIEEGAMPNLSSLSVVWCRNLRMLPEGLQHLGNLHEFVCKDMSCHFFDRLKVDRGEDWNKIAHVPHFQIEETSSQMAALLAVASQYTAKAKVGMEGLEIEDVVERLGIEEASLATRARDMLNWLVEEMEKLVDYLSDKEAVEMERCEISPEEERLLNDVRDVAFRVRDLQERFCSFVFGFRTRNIWDSFQRHAFKASYFKDLRLIAEDAQSLVKRM